MSRYADSNIGMLCFRNGKFYKDHYHKPGKFKPFKNSKIRWMSAYCPMKDWTHLREGWECLDWNKNRAFEFSHYIRYVKTYE